MDAQKPSDLFKEAEAEAVVAEVNKVAPARTARPGNRLPLIAPIKKAKKHADLPRVGHRRAKVKRNTPKPTGDGLAITNEFLRRQNEAHVEFVTEAI